MREAAGLAALHHPHPNPRVGALVVAPDGTIAGRAAHGRAGGPHAEVLALAEAGDAAAGGTVVVTLEPCVHHGRTPPCVDSLIASGVRQVVVGAIDPDPRVSGRGVAALEAAGVEVVLGLDRDEGEAVDPGYFHHRRTGRPRVTLKLAMTLDGQTATATGASQWITSPEARRDVHLLRSRSDAVMVGSGTVRADDPMLTVRLDRYRGHQPRPVVVGGRKPIPPAAALLDRDPLIYLPDPDPALPGAIALGDGSRVDLGAAIADLGERGIVDLLVEGGATLAASVHGDRLVDRYVLYLAASIAGGTGLPAFAAPFEDLMESAPVRITDVTRVGPDLRVEAVPG